MTTARDELIAQWRQKLADARQAASSDPRRAWLSAMRVRLYRFLLSCYGASPWNTNPRPQKSEPNAALTHVPDAGELSGKPPKSIGQIQSVLKSVANAQDHAPQPGPLVHGLEPDSWVVVAAASSKSDIAAIVRELTRRGIAARRSIRGDDDVAEVQAVNRHTALAIVDSVPKKRKGRQRGVAGGPRAVVTTLQQASPVQAAIIYLATIGLFFGIVAFLSNFSLVRAAQSDWYSALLSMNRMDFAILGGCVAVAVYVAARTFINARHSGRREVRP